MGRKKGCRMSTRITHQADGTARGQTQQNTANSIIDRFRAIPHNSKCRYGERGAAAAKPKAQIILDAAKVSAASGGNSEPKQGQRSQSARGFCPRSTMRVPQPDIIEHFGNADAVPQPPERCLSRKAGIVRCCLRDDHAGSGKLLGGSIRMQDKSIGNLHGDHRGKHRADEVQEIGDIIHGENNRAHGANDGHDQSDLLALELGGDGLGRDTGVSKHPGRW